MSAKSQVLGANQPADRFYRGGERIAAFRRSGTAASRTPEDWVGSVTPLFGEVHLGRTVLSDGNLLADAVAADPVGWLGAAHVSRFGSDTALLVKLLDAGERLPVHAHPDVPFARRHLGLMHGKTEAWIFLEGAEVSLGFSRDVGVEELAEWVARQHVEDMLGAMHTLRVTSGDVVFVPAGMPHAIGEGALLVELQEPTDLSILMEWRGFAIDGESEGHLGLGFDTALAAVDRRGRTRAELSSLVTATAGDVGDLLAPASDFFRAERLRGPMPWDAGFSVVVCVDGEATATAESGEVLPLERGTTALTAHASGAWSVEACGDFEAIRCRPPRV